MYVLSSGSLLRTEQRTFEALSQSTLQRTTVNIFITVGTTPFDELIQACDEKLDPQKYAVKAQISDTAKYIPKSFESFAYDPDIQVHYEWADVIISHAGAGTFYQLMEMGKKVIFVPNQTLKDSHQNDICTYALKHNYAFVLNDVTALEMFLAKIQDHHFIPYEKDTDEISQTIYHIIRGQEI